MDTAAARARRRAAFVVLVGTAIGAALIASRRHLMPAPPSGARTSLILLLFGAFAVVPLLALSAYLWRFGARARAEGRFPPARTATIHPAVVLTGLAGRRRARLFQGLAVFFGAAALIMAGLLWRLSRLLPYG